MQIRIFTLPFDELSEGFPDEIISEFCLNKKVLRIETQFFRREGRPFWSVAVHYEIVLPDTDKLRELDDGQKLLFQRLKEWRKEAAAKEGLPDCHQCPVHPDDPPAVPHAGELQERERVRQKARTEIRQADQ